MIPGMSSIPSITGGAGGAAGPAKSGDVFSESRFGGDFNVATGGGGVGLNMKMVAVIAGALLLAVIVWKKL